MTKTLKDYLLNGNIQNRFFVDRNDERTYKILDMSIGRACGFDFVFLQINYLDRKYKEGEEDLRSLTLALDDLEAVVEKVAH